MGKFSKSNLWRSSHY